MDIGGQVREFLESQGEAERGEMLALHDLIRGVAPGSRLWYSDGRDEKGKVVSNPSIGYGSYRIQYADGSSKEFFRVGLSAHSTGISVYVMGLKEKTQLPQMIGATIGKAKVTGYCITFKKLADIDLGELERVIRFRLEMDE